MLIRRAEIDGERGVDLRLRGDRIAELARSLEPEGDEPVLDARGGALLPGLHDHHIHLLSLAAALRSVRCGPPEVTGRAGLATALRTAARSTQATTWIRGVGYHESVAGELDAQLLEDMAPGHPLRVQHRSGALWVLNQTALRALGLDGSRPDDEPPGLERDERGRPTGRIYRADAWLRSRMEAPAPPPLSRVGRLLARFGVTGVTDATPHNEAAELELLCGAVDEGALPLTIDVMGRPALPLPHQPGVRRHAVKWVLSEAVSLDLEATATVFARAHAASRPVAVHCVTRAELATAVAAFRVAGPLPGDRVEHASVAPPDLCEALAALGITVVTQPNFVRERGDAYRREVEPDDRDWLYRCQGLIDAGVPLGGGTDAPFGEPDPWLAMQAAVDRRTRGGDCLGPDERLSPERALALFTSPPDAPGAAPRRIEVGARADLCLLADPWARARDALDSSRVRATFAGGRCSFGEGSWG